jgi:hypothetical protein
MLILMPSGVALVGELQADDEAVFDGDIGRLMNSSLSLPRIISLLLDLIGDLRSIFGEWISSSCGDDDDDDDGDDNSDEGFFRHTSR